MMSKSKSLNFGNGLISMILMLLLVYLGSSMMFNKADDLLLIIAGFLFLAIAFYIAFNFYDLNSEVTTDGF